MPHRTSHRAGSVKAHLWVCATSAGPGDWTATPLTGEPIRPAPPLDLRCAASGVWVAVGPPAVHVNGAPLDLGLRVLRDRDELRHGAIRAFFSTESLPEVVPFPGAERATFCPRCKLEILPEMAAVRCPGCAVWQHVTDELPCWTYDAHCALCDQPSALDGGLRWTPEDL